MISYAVLCLKKKNKWLAALQSPTLSTTELLLHSTPVTTTPELVSIIKQTFSDENLPVLTR